MIHGSKAKAAAGPSRPPQMPKPAAKPSSMASPKSSMDASWVLKGVLEAMAGHYAKITSRPVDEVLRTPWECARLWASMEFAFKVGGNLDLGVRSPSREHSQRCLVQGDGILCCQDGGTSTEALARGIQQLSVIAGTGGLARSGVLHGVRVAVLRCRKGKGDGGSSQPYNPKPQNPEANMTLKPVRI